ncbi:hypothetical protein CP532_3819 [Ophiocordyceps camponoti-leonardi (nom. inval.)]|nr:hypothetical protein CP532_3819 [Ophiocordyceps camponoti-leonardi (nom. inval.)]
MISSNTRASRSASRYSSPAQPGWGSSGGNEGSRALMARWLEPSVQSKASFEEAGLVRYGVLENMAPLGTMPKSKKSTAPAEGSAVRKIILRPSAKPTPQVSPSPSSPQPPAEQAKAKADQGPELDTTRRRRSTRASLPSRKLRRDEETPEASVIMAKTPSPSKKPPVEPEEREFTDKVVEAAVDEALRHYRYPTAWALRTLYDERCDDADFVAMVDDVFRQTADAETRNRFGRLVEAKKREGKRDNQGCYYFEPPTTNSRFSPHKAKPAPYAALLLRRRPADDDDDDEDDEDRHNININSKNGDETDHETEERAAKRPKTSSTGAVVMVRTPRSSKVGRRNSASSMSSLSSAMSLSSPEVRAISPVEEEDEDEEAPMQVVGREEVEGKEKEKERQEQQEPEPEPKRHQPPRQGSESNSPTLVRRTRARGGPPPPAPPMADEEERETRSASPDEAFARRRHARRVTNGHGVRESAVRAVLATPPPLAASASTSVSTPASAPVVSASVSAAFAPTAAAAAAAAAAPASAAAAASRRPRRIVVAPPPTTRATRSAKKRRPSVESPAAFSWQVDDDDDHNNDAATTTAAAADGSRAATPRPAKKQRTGLRVKTSPVKKKGGTAAGVPRPVTDAAGAANKDHTSDNDEYCSACGNAGDVVCCDGCPRSFHFECVDMVQSDRLPDEWYCNECLIRRFPSRVPVHKGIFASALNNLEKCIPRAFSLPAKVQNRFEGVRAGADGDYEEVVPPKATTTKKRPGYDELPDFFKQRDDGQAVLCHACQKPATAGIRAIITCSACPFHWHLDCLDPPLAVPPVLKTWRCPAHVDDVLSQVPRLAPAHRFRRIKGSQPVTPALTRGLKNNGHIEIDWSDEVDRSGWPDASSFGRTYKLASHGIVLDFIEQLRRQGAGYGPRRNEPRRVPCPFSSQPVHDGPLAGSTLERSLEEMQLSLTLVSLRERPTDGIEQLTSALLSVADDNVVSLMAKTNADNVAKGRLSASDKKGLGALLAQMEAMGQKIRSMLDEGEEKPCSASAGGGGGGGGGRGREGAGDGIVPLPQPLAEPTPPSTVDHAEGSMDLE